MVYDWFLKYRPAFRDEFQFFFKRVPPNRTLSGLVASATTWCRPCVNCCRSRQRKRMHDNGLTTWLADQLVRKSEFAGDRNKHEMYDLEYGLALFMNLCRRPSAVRACMSRARDLFKSLTVFMTSLGADVSNQAVMCRITVILRRLGQLSPPPPPPPPPSSLARIRILYIRI